MLSADADVAVDTVFYQEFKELKELFYPLMRMWLPPRICLKEKREIIELISADADVAAAIINE